MFEWITLTVAAIALVLAIYFQQDKEKRTSKGKLALWALGVTVVIVGIEYVRRHML